MSSVILDTNALAMVLTDDPRLPERARQAIEAATSASVSAITFYEIGQKVRLGKWDAMAPFVEDLIEIVVGDGFSLLPLNAQHTLNAALLDWTHRDPFDRLIAAVVMSEDAMLVSSDAAFDALETIPRVWA